MKRDPCLRRKDDENWTFWILYACLKRVHGTQARGRFQKVPQLAEGARPAHRCETPGRPRNVGSIPAGNAYLVEPPSRAKSQTEIRPNSCLKWNVSAQLFRSPFTVTRRSACIFVSRKISRSLETFFVAKLSRKKRLSGSSPVGSAPRNRSAQRIRGRFGTDSLFTARSFLIAVRQMIL